ncbi:MAG: DinB family protein [Gemmatimonadaceae bacterium]|nr:DinB family protein [Gemmatimonadaceae bacterium]
MLKRALVLLLVSAASLSAQQLTAAGSARLLWKDAAHNIAESAVDMPADKFSFRPTAGVRSFGELVAHVAGAEQMFCAIALGEKPPAEDAVEKSATTKAALIAALAASSSACDRAYAQSDSASAAAINLFGQPRTRLHALLMNATHDNEHYGNIVTYLRMNGLVPPTSKPRKPAT